MRILVTGGAGFIGSNLVENLLAHSDVQQVRVLDNLATGFKNNLEEFFSHPKFEFVEGDIRDFNVCFDACNGIDLISHQAALGSVPRSVRDPLTTNEVNITGTLNIFTAAKENKIKRVVYASSSSVYGDHPALPKTETQTGNLLSPYAVSKAANELYASVYAHVYGTEFIGLRYFNVFGPKQNPGGAYAAVIPLFITAVLNDQPPVINGDGGHSRDFTFVANAVKANLLALFTTDRAAVNTVYNIACGQQKTLNELFSDLKKIGGSSAEPKYGPERIGDVKHSLADISKARKRLGYEPVISVEDGLKRTFEWYQEKFKSVKSLEV